MRYVAQAEFEVDDEAIIPDILTLLETVLPYMTDNVTVSTWQVPMIQPDIDVANPATWHEEVSDG